MGTPNSVKVTVMLEELLALGHAGTEYDVWLIQIGWRTVSRCAAGEYPCVRGTREPDARVGASSSTWVLRFGACPPGHIWWEVGWGPDMETKRDRGVLGIFKAAVKGFGEDDCMTMAAALSYATVFSLPPLLALILVGVGLAWDPEDARELVQTQVGALLGKTAIDQMQSIMEDAEQPPSGNVVAVLSGGAALLIGGAGAFVQLQASLNRVWGVTPDPARGGVKGFVLKRMFSFGVLLTFAFLLLVSLVLSAALTAFGGVIANLLPGDGAKVLLDVFNVVVSFGVIMVLLAAIFKIVPDAVISWRDTWAGALVTAILFVLGKALLGVYLGRANPGEAFGAAASLAAFLVWTYYAAAIVLFGAEFTQTWANVRGGGIQPKRGAMRVEQQTLTGEAAVVAADANAAHGSGTS